MIAAQQLVAAGMTAYVRTGFRLRTFGLDNLRLEPGTIVTPNHRSDNDVPVLVSALAGPWGRAVRAGIPWPTFAADDHAFFRGFLAGYPEGLPLAARRLLWPVRVGGPLERWLQCVPVRQPAQMRLVELLRRAPERPLNGRLPADLNEALARRAARLGSRPPARAREALSGGFADLLWTEITRDDTTESDDIWRAHLHTAVGDFRRLILTLRDGGIVVIFPEGELITDGHIGPLASGVATLARRGRARLVQPVAIAYDRLTVGRPRAYVSVAPAVAPAAGGVRDAIAESVRRAIPLTAGQIAATVLRRGGGRRDLFRTAAEAVRVARRDGRPIEPSLLEGRQAAALAESFWQARRRGPDHEVVTALASELMTATGSP
jgi:1-acyl-sn-glycerol-3-phosphate acyltransferase